MTTVIDRPAVLGGTPIRARDYPAWPVWDEHERANLLAVLEAGGWWQGDGDAASTFAAELAHYQGARHGLALTNGTHALEAALAACDIGEGDEVIVPGLTFVASATAVLAVNATPVLVDIDPDTLCLDPEAAEAAITPRTRAIVVVHVAGAAADLDAIVDLCRRRGLRLIEDCAHAHGTTWRGRGVGSWGDVGCFSMQRSKLMTAGEGGALVCNDEQLRDLAWSYADCGREAGEWFYHHVRYGSNLRMTEWQGAVLRAQLARYPAQLRRRDENAAALDLAIAEVPGLRPQRLDPRMDVDGRYCYVRPLRRRGVRGAAPARAGGRAGRGGHPDERLVPGRHRPRPLPPPAVRSPPAGQRAAARLRRPPPPAGGARGGIDGLAPAPPPAGRPRGRPRRGPRRGGIQAHAAEIQATA